MVCDWGKFVSVLGFLACEFGNPVCDRGIFVNDLGGPFVSAASWLVAGEKFVCVLEASWFMTWGIPFC